MITRIPDLSPEESAKINADVIGKKYTTQDYEQSEQALLLYNNLLEKQKKLDEQGNGQKAASDEVWQYAWKEREEYYRIKNARKESHSSPDPLLMDKASTLPPSSAERRNIENVKSTIDNTAANVGSGLDTLTRESYKETKRLVKHSDMLQEGIQQPLPSADKLTGEEQGTIVSNLQSWQPALTNAVKPVSDAIGSHADTTSSINKSQLGSDHILPTAVSSHLDNITPHFTNEMDVAFKSIQVDSMQHMPSKMCGSLPHLAHANSNCSVPFEIASDTYNGLLKMMDQIANFADSIMSNMTLFNLSPLGGLKDGIFPKNQLALLLGPISKFTNQIGGLNNLLGGFGAISSISNAIGGIGSGLSSLLTNPSKLAAMLVAGANVAAIVGGIAGKSVKCASSQLDLDITPLGMDLNLNISAQLNGIVGGTNKFGTGLGNIGFVLGGGVNKNLGRTTLNIRNPQQIIAGILPPEISKILKKLDKLSNLGLVGNLGFSIGASFNSLTDSSFSVSMSKYATHASIVGPLFNKQTKKMGSYSQEASLDKFQESKFVKGAQGNKGVTLLGPGATSSQKVFTN